MKGVRSASTAKSRWLRASLGGGIFTLLAGCTAILGFDKDVFEQGREVSQDGSVSQPPSTDAGTTDAPSLETQNRGLPDPTFGDAGTAEIEASLYWALDNPTSVVDECRAILDAAGRIIVACAVNAQQPKVGMPPLETKVFRLSKDGALDVGFGAADGGVVDVLHYVPELALRPNGGFLLAGFHDIPTKIRYDTGKNIVLAFSGDGVSDPSFADAGALEAPLTADNESDKIVAVRRVGDAIVMAFWVLTKAPDGSFVFDGSGWLELDANTNVVTRMANPKNPAFVGDLASGVVRPSTDRTVLVGAARAGGYNNAVVSLTAFVGDQIDTSFGDAGRALVRTLAGDFAQAATVVGVFAQNPERFLVTTSTSPFDGGAALVQVTSSGQPDMAFGDAGVSPFPLAPFDPPPRLVALSALLAADGKVVVGGALTFGDGSRRPFIARLLPNGDIDPSFGKNGWLTPTFAPTTEAKIEQLLFTEEGHLVAVGSALMESGRRNVFVMRFR